MVNIIFKRFVSVGNSNSGYFHYLIYFDAIMTPYYRKNLIPLKQITKTWLVLFYIGY